MPTIDHLQRFIFEHANIRGGIVHLEKTYQSILQQRPYPAPVHKLLTEAILSCLLLTDGIKFEGYLSLQFQGDSRLPLLLVQCDAKLQVRGFAKFAENLDEQAYLDAFLQGKMVLTINQTNQPQAYQSVVPIQSSSMSENLAYYFAQSEQLTTKVWLAVGEKQAAGMLLQLMPDQKSQEREQFWEYAVQLGQTVSDQELLQLENPLLLHRLYHETELRLFDPRPISFKCRCSPEKMKEVLAILGEEEAHKLLEEKEQIEINCDFCNQHYVFDAIDIALIFQQHGKPDK